ncbi:MAG: ABC transporter permease subunit, partial [Minisyncoccia bacterium]
MWSWPFTFKVLPKLLSAAKITFIATILGFLLASFLGLVWTLLKRAKIHWISKSTTAIVEFIRRTPLLIQLFFLYYTLPNFNIRLPALTVGIIGLGLHYSTYLSEVYRAGIESVEKEQWEAAKSLNFTP